MLGSTKYLSTHTRAHTERGKKAGDREKTLAICPPNGQKMGHEKKKNCHPLHHSPFIYSFVRL